MHTLKTPQHRICLALTMAALLAVMPKAMAQVAGPPVPRSMSQPQANPIEQVKDVKKKLTDFFTGRKPDPKTTTNAPTSPNTVNPAFARQAIKTPATPAAVAPKPPERPPMLVAPEPADIQVEKPRISKDNPPPKLPALDNPANGLGLVDPQNKLNAAAAAIDRKDYGTAKAILVPLRASLVDTTEAHINLYKALDNVSTARTQAELEKQLALQFAMMRDKTMYQSARVSIAEHDYRTAIKDLVEVIKSQPRSELGLKAYNLLQEIGFTEKLQIAE
jgi:TolA-binding protein